MHILGIIPARAGSRGIPDKNLAVLAGKPLLGHTCEQALASATLTRVIVSTDSESITACARSYGVEVPFLRPRELASDETPMLHVLRHAVSTLRAAEGYEPHVVVLLQVTSPLRRTEHIDTAVHLLLSSHADSVVSVVPVPHQFSPTSLLQLIDGCLSPWTGDPSACRRQEKPLLYARNGPAVLVVRREVLESQGLFGEDCRPLVMPPEESIDVDTPFDLAVAGWLLQHR